MAYCVKKSAQAISKCYFYHSCIWISVLVNYNYRSWNGVSLSLISILYNIA